jgi:hypothetical protein
LNTGAGIPSDGRPKLEEKMAQRQAWICAIVLGCLTVSTPLAALPWGKQWVGDAELPKPVGIGFDVFSMDQGYVISDLSLAIPGFDVSAVSGLEVDNSITELNVKVDAWLLPFLNVFGIVGKIDGTTLVDLRRASIVLPFQNIQIDYDGTVYGGGLTLAIGKGRYFGSLTYTYTESNLGGDFDSSVQAQTLMPKVGLSGDHGSFWVGAFYLSAEETHRGTTTVPILGTVGFDIALQEEEALSYTIGGAVHWGERFTLTMEGGFSGRTTTLISAGWRF